MVYNTEPVLIDGNKFKINAQGKVFREAADGDWIRSTMTVEEVNSYRKRRVSYLEKKKVWKLNSKKSLTESSHRL